MNCPYCLSVTTREQNRKTTLDYRIFRCRGRHPIFNERTNTPFNFLEYPTDLVLLVVLWRLRSTLGLWNLAERYCQLIRWDETSICFIPANKLTVSALALQRQCFLPRALAFVDLETWYSLREQLAFRREARRKQLRFRKNPSAYLAALEEVLLKTGLPS